MHAITTTHLLCAAAAVVGAAALAQPAPAGGAAMNGHRPTRPAETVTVIDQTGGSSGFDWGDSGIGVAAGIGLTLSAAAALALRRKSPRTTPTTRGGRR
jgi:hypothetical protein